MTGKVVQDGGCLCGSIRYRLSGEPSSVTHCHCAMCRRASGAPVSTWITLAKTDFAFTQGEPAVYRSSDQGERSFCADCGSPLTFRSSRWPDDVDVTLGSLDRPGSFPPDHEIWTSSRLSWLHLHHDLPSYPEWSESEES